ncbi:MAG: long-chain fatty acid--CoA ligase [Candidatus Obscuribacterales bacterium]|jgi:long-chain acyl-CoA synthetase|nr:long-chain fatty acid--CoA ligase [Candidatus Obscuribacterales bacterium]
MSANTLIHTFWTRVFGSPESLAATVKNPHANEPPILVMGVPGAMPPHYVFPNELASITWRSCGLAVASIMVFLRQNGIKKGDRVAIIAWNCPEWTWADLAIQSLGAITVPIYPHSTAEQAAYVVKDAGAKLLLSNEQEQLDKLANVEGVRAFHVDRIPNEIELLPGTVGTKPFLNRFLGYQDEGAERWTGVAAQLFQLHSTLKSRRFCGLQDDDLATIIYTSGSSGVPKGCMLTHGNISAALDAIAEHGFEMDSSDRYLSYLPLAHVYERINGTAMSIRQGVPIGYCKVEDVKNRERSALSIFSPSVLCGVPAVWRGMKESIKAKIAKSGPLSQRIANWAFQQKEPGFKRFVADLLVFRKIRNGLGGKLDIMLSGGAPISPDVLEFFQTIGLELLQGYGMTETTGGITTNRPSRLADSRGPVNKIGSVGQPVPGIQVKIQSEPGEENTGTGEILLRGPQIFKGYWNMPEETAKTFTADGWLKTGDLGHLDEDGFLFITGRKKRQGKTEQGKYVAPEKIEKCFESFPLVQYILPIFDGRKYVSGLVFLNQLMARQLIGRPIPAGVDAAAYLAEQPELLKAVQEAVDGVNTKLERWEQLKKFKIIPVEATVANGLLTPTLKIRFEEASKRFKNEIEALYQ